MSKRHEHMLAQKPCELEVVPLRETETLFSDETLASLRELGTVLEPICRRLIAEGKLTRTEDGRIIEAPTIQV